MDGETWAWWTALRAASVANLALLAATAAWAPTDDPIRRAHLACASVYTVVCAFRSFYPRVDLERTVLVDHWLSSIALGRSAATVAELAFTVQCALVTVRLAPASGLPAGLGWGLVPLVAAAQGACWLGVLTGRHLWHAVEEALWAGMMAAIAGVLLLAFPSLEGPWRALAPLGLVGCALGAFVMLGLDVPMYLRRYRAEVAAGRRFASVPAGFVDALRRREPSGAWAVWRPEVAWMTPYFTACVWLSLLLVWFG